MNHESEIGSVSDLGHFYKTRFADTRSGLSAYKDPSDV